MDVFEVQRQLVDEYKSYVESFVSIRDPVLKGFVAEEYRKDRYWPEALVQLNPAFASGSPIPDLVASGLLHPGCDPIFRAGKDAGSGTPLHLHRHQQDAVEVAKSRQSYVLTTGTGSGKSLAYFIPIVDRVLRDQRRPGLKAIVVYPMNALCNSQLEELEKFLGPAETSSVTYARYTGQEDDEARNRIRANPPHILLTNYVMLELILTRTEDRPLLDKARGLEFLVLDELHTYRGRQGADVAMLVRRLRERAGVPDLQCVGTSATMASEGNHADRQERVASVASTLFGAEVTPERVIGETLEPLFSAEAVDPAELRQAVQDIANGVVPQDAEDFVRNPLASWIESTFGTELRDGRFERVTPSTISDGAEALQQLTGIPAETGAAAIRTMLLRGYQLPHPGTQRPVFAFRLHQFITRGDTVFSTLETGSERFLTLDGQTVVPGDLTRRLYPMSFCRSCGEGYFSVDVAQHHGAPALIAREFRDLAAQGDDQRSSGYLWLDSGVNIEGDPDAFAFQPERLPDQYIMERGEALSPTREIRKRIIPATVGTDGFVQLHDNDGPSDAWFIKGRLPFCLHCRETWESNVGEFTKLGSLASEGRAGATTMITLKLVQALRGSPDLPADARKVLSFTDNRQDASLQAGHFNDFIVTSMLRAGILAALPDSGVKTFDNLPDAVLSALNLNHDDYAAAGVSEGLGRRRARDAFRDVLSWRIFRDLRRGWRVNQPNLEQLSLLRVDYEALDDLATDTAFWADLPVHLNDLACRHPLRGGVTSDPWAWLHDGDLPGVLRRIGDATPEIRLALLRAVLEHFRREIAIQAPVLAEDSVLALRDRVRQNLNDLWGFDEGEQLEPATPLRVGKRQRKGWEKAADLTPSSRTGRRIADPILWQLPRGSRRLSLTERVLVLHILTRALAKYGHLNEPSEQHFLLAADVLHWSRVSPGSETDTSLNAFFRHFYITLAEALPFPDAPGNIRTMRAREHTAQVPSDLRQERENEFREGTLPVLYCSPTMELGVDISSLNAVNMRNVPPTPANYAQRSGRAGRASQPAIVVTYCSATSPHDQYYFENRKKMVAGVVSPPRIDLANRELIASHMHAVWLAETGARLRSSLVDVLDIEDPTTVLPVREQLRQQLESKFARDQALARCERILSPMGEFLQDARWYRPGWIAELLRNAPVAFDRACDRWRLLFRSATRQIEDQHRRSNDMALTPEDRRRAARLRDEAERQRELLIESQSTSNDFYTFRYLASEGFLPGYNFPRLPLTAFIPSRRGGRQDGEYLQRPRFIAISEYGPGNSIYYEGSRYRVDRIDLPTSNDAGGGITETIKVCSLCGYAHTGQRVNADVCGNPMCRAPIIDPFASEKLLRLQNVKTRRVERINSEEEERVRQGFDLKSAIEFAEVAQGFDLTRGQAMLDQADAHADLVYAPAARIWRINLGWRRRRDKASYGFWLDMNHGVWSGKEDPQNAAGVEAPGVKPEALDRVVPYVTDHQNALLLNLVPAGIERLVSKGGTLGPEHYLSLGYALKRGVCVEFQLEDDELGMELLPDAERPQVILFTESSEGGAGVLDRLVHVPDSLRRVARAALEVCHFDPDTGADLGLDQECGIACYHCLLSYGNQRYHPLLNRLLLRDLLLAWRGIDVLVAGHLVSRADLRDELKKLSGSTLETAFVDWLYDHGYRLPDKAQVLVADGLARPDFYVEEARACVYVDGPAHEHPDTAVRDKDARRQLERLGYQVISVTYPEHWATEISDWADVFGEGVRP